MFEAARIKDVYVSSHRRGFLAISDIPMCRDSASGSSGNHVVIAVKRVVRVNGQWNWADPTPPGELWLRKAWDEAVALTGSEPWRLYRLDAAEVGRLLDGGAFTDDIRGFKNRLEPWQPKGSVWWNELPGHTSPADASFWERTDGWRVNLGQGRWAADGAHCNADRSVLKYSPAHFAPLAGEWPDAASAMAAVDAARPWS